MVPQAPGPSEGMDHPPARRAELLTAHREPFDEAIPLHLRGYVEQMAAWVRKLSFPQLVAALHEKHPEMFPGGNAPLDPGCFDAYAQNT